MSEIAPRFPIHWHDRIGVTPMNANEVWPSSATTDCGGREVAVATRAVRTQAGHGTSSHAENRHGGFAAHGQ